MATQIASLFATISADLQPLNQGLSTAQSKISGFGTLLSTGFGSALGVVGGALMNTAISKIAELATGVIGLGKQAISMATDFESQMSILSIAAKSTGLTFDQLHDAAIQVGGDTSLVGVSASGAAEAMTGLFKAGLTTTEIFGDLQGVMDGTVDLGGALRAAIDLAAATELDMVQASDLAAVALASFGAELVTEEERAGFITEAMNNLVQAADASVAEVGDLAAALANIGPTASAMGISLQETNNALAILSTRGIAGAEAGTQLKSMLTNIQRTTPAVTDTLSRLGIELFDTEGTMRSLPNIIGQLETAMSGLTQEQKNQAIQTLAGTFGMNAMNALLGEGVSGWNAMAMATSGATIEQKGLIEKLLQTEFGMDRTVDLLADGVNFWDAIADSTANMSDEQRQLAIRQVASTLGMVDQNGVIDESITSWQDLANATSGAATIQEQAAAKANTFAGAWESFQGTLETVGIGIGEAFLPIMTALAKTFSGFVDDSGPMLVDFFANLGTWLSEILPVAIQALAAFWTGTLVPAMTAVWAFIQASVIPMLASLWAWLQTSIPLAIQALSALWTGILLPAITAVWNIIQNTLIPAFMVLWSWLQTALPLAIQVLSDVWNTYILPMFAAFVEQWNTNIQPALAALWTWLQTNIPIAIQFLSDMWTNVLQPALVVVAEFVTGTMIPLFGKIVGWLIENIPVALEFLGNLWANVIWPALSTAIKFFMDVIVPLWTKVINWLQVVIPAALAALNVIWTQVVWPALQKAFETVWGVIEPLWESLKTWLDDTLPVALEFLRALWEDTVWPAIQKALETVWDIIKPIFESLKIWFEEKIPDALELLRAVWVDEVWPAIQGAFEAVWKILEPLWIELSEWLDENLPTVLSNLQFAWETAWTAIQDAFEVVWGVIEPIWEKIKTWLDTTFGAALDAAQTKSDTVWGAIETAISTAGDIIASIFDGIKVFADWLSGHTFKFKLNLPSIPNWAEPGSPIPLHTAWKNFGEYMNTHPIKPMIDVAGIGPIANEPARQFTRNLVNVAQATAAQPVTVEARTPISIHTLNVHAQDADDLISQLQNLTIAPTRA